MVIIPHLLSSLTTKHNAPPRFLLSGIRPRPIWNHPSNPEKYNSSWTSHPSPPVNDAQPPTIQTKNALHSAHLCQKFDSPATDVVTIHNYLPLPTTAIESFSTLPIHPHSLSHGKLPKKKRELTRMPQLQDHRSC
eukprot:GHVP01069275.1.p2 GENE.GHVP01069275.1~~GHVP01069275.1.p2  ORF type:complete len:135 (-),score=2.00 GHVP01069275.1:709-1113(-)